MIKNPATKNAALLQKIRAVRYASSLGAQEDGGTLLIWLCHEKKREPVALALLATGHARPEFVTYNGGSALFFACVNEMPRLAMAILDKTGGAEANHVYDPDGQTALLWSCQHGMKEVALRLLATRSHGLPEAINRDGDTALLWACSQKKMTEVAIAMIPLLVASGHADVVGHANAQGETALLWACDIKKEELALRLLGTRHANPAQINRLGDTALITAAFNDMHLVVIHMLQDSAAPTYVNYVDTGGYSALYYMLFQYLNKKQTHESVTFIGMAVMDYLRHGWILDPAHEPVLQELCALGRDHPKVRALLEEVDRWGGDPTSLENLCLPAVSAKASRPARRMLTAQRQQTLRTRDLARSMVLANRRRQTQRVRATHIPVVQGDLSPQETYVSFHHSRGERMRKPSL